MIDLSRRGLMKLFGLASTTVVDPGMKLTDYAIAQAKAVAPLPVESSPADIPAQDYATLMSNPVDWAQQEIDRMRWSRLYTIPEKEIRQSILCFRSASDVIKRNWEIDERKKESREQYIYDAAINLLKSGKVTL